MATWASIAFATQKMNNPTERISLLISKPISQWNFWKFHSPEVKQVLHLGCDCDLWSSMSLCPACGTAFTSCTKSCWICLNSFCLNVETHNTDPSLQSVARWWTFHHLDLETHTTGHHGNLYPNFWWQHDIGILSPALQLTRSLSCPDAVRLVQNKNVQKAWPVPVFLGKPFCTTGQGPEGPGASESYCKYSKHVLHCGSYRYS